MPLRLYSKKIFATLFAIVVILVSCKKDHDSPGGGSVPEKKISRVYQDPQNYLEFTYNADGTLGKVKLAEEELASESQTLEISYNANKRISGILTEEGYRITYRYENGKLIATETKDAVGEVLTSASFLYDNDKLVDYATFLPFPLPDGSDGVTYKRVQESKYEYNTDKSIRAITTRLMNPITQKMETAGRRVYEKYDGKINPMKFLPDFSFGFFQELNASNILKEVGYGADGSVEETVERSFTYDQDGYPLTCTEKTIESGQPAVTKTLTFSYK